MPVPFTATQIKAWFETGDVPTQQQFADFVDTIFHMVQQAQDQADAAVALAEQAAQCYGLVTLSYPGADGAMAYTVERASACAIAITTARAFATVTTSNDHWLVTATITLTPDVDFVDDDTTVMLTPSMNEDVNGNNSVAKAQPATITRAIGSIIIEQKFLFPRTGASNRKLNLLVMP